MRSTRRSWRPPPGEVAIPAFCYVCKDDHLFLRWWIVRQDVNSSQVNHASYKFPSQALLVTKMRIVPE
jgi:hypothetical protein